MPAQNTVLLAEQVEAPQQTASSSGDAEEDERKGECVAAAGTGGQVGDPAVMRDTTPEAAQQCNAL